MEFFPNGRVLARWHSGPSGAGRYEFVERDRMLLTWQSAASEGGATYRVQIVEDVLVLCRPGQSPGECVTYQRAAGGGN